MTGSFSLQYNLKLQSSVERKNTTKKCVKTDVKRPSLLGKSIIGSQRQLGRYRGGNTCLADAPSLSCITTTHLGRLKHLLAACLESVHASSEQTSGADSVPPGRRQLTPRLSAASSFKVIADQLASKCFQIPNTWRNTFDLESWKFVESLGCLPAQLLLGRRELTFLSGWSRIQVLVKGGEGEQLSYPPQGLCLCPGEELWCLPGPEGSESLARR